MQQNLKFENRDGLELSGALQLPDTGETLAYALYAHCFTCTKSINAAVIITNELARRGIATLRFDFTGLGDSKGKFANSNFSTNINDVVDAAGFLENTHQAPQLLIGHSLGGTAVLAAAKHIESARAVASIGSPSNPEHILHLLEEHLGTLEQDGSVDVKLAGRPFTFKQEFVEDVRNHSIDYRNLRKALMVMHSPLDDTVSINEAGKIFASALHPKSFVSLETADHLLSKKTDASYAAEVLASWASRYIEAAQLEPQTDDGVTISADTNKGFLCEINSNGHQLIADEPRSMGGTNLGATPYDYLGIALGSCTAMTLNMYARHKKIDLNNVTVNVAHSRVHADDCVDCEKQTGQIDVLSRVIRLDGDLTPEQETRMLQIADRCPVHKTLENEIKVETQIQP